MIKIKTLQKYGSEEVAKLNVWVTWSVSAVTGQSPINIKVVNQAGIGAVTTVNGGLRYRHKVEPESILEVVGDIPDLSGPKETDPSPVDERHPLFTDEFLKNGASRKWDASRQMRFKHANPNNLPAHAFSQPPPLISIPNFPVNPIEGNDDKGEGDEVAPNSDISNDPYSQLTQKSVWSTDVPLFSISKGNLNDAFVFSMQFNEFPRLEIRKKWYRIGVYSPWRFKASMRKVDHAQIGPYWNADPSIVDPIVVETNHNDF